MSRASTTGCLQYLEPSVASSLYRNGRVSTRRDADGSDTRWEGAVFCAQTVRIHDARGLATPPTLHDNGFERLTEPGPADLDFFDHEQVVRRYYPHCARIIAEAVGASEVVAFDHNVRSALGKKNRKRIDKGQQVQGPAHVAHGDYTLRSGPERLQQLTRPPAGNDTLRLLGDSDEPVLDPERVALALSGKRRFAIVNLWRNIAAEPVATNPLALCDARTVEPEELVVFEIHYRDRIGENYFCKHTERHRWSYYPAMTTDEALLIKQWDSVGTLARSKGERSDAADPTAPCTFSLHSAFEDPASPPDAPDRWSIEVRCAVLYDD